MRRAAGARFSAATDGVAAVEFALVLPLLCVLLFGGYATSEYLWVNRQVKLTCRTMADLSSKYASLSSSDMAAIMNASSLVIAPYSTANLTIRLSEITTDATGLIAQVAWSKGFNTSGYGAGSAYALPAEMHSPNTSYILSEVSYAYTPTIQFGPTDLFVSSAHLFTTPRFGGSVGYTGS